MCEKRLIGLPLRRACLLRRRSHLKELLPHISQQLSLDPSYLKNISIINELDLILADPNHSCCILLDVR